MSDWLDEFGACKMCEEKLRHSEGCPYNALQWRVGVLEELIRANSRYLRNLHDGELSVDFANRVADAMDAVVPPDDPGA